MSLLFKNLRIHQIFGANTDVGKTVLTSALVRASAAKGASVYYLKPVSTGPLDVADDEHVKRFAGHYKDKVDSTCLFRFDEPVSPHLAARLAKEQTGREVAVPSDETFANAVAHHIRQCATRVTRPSHMYVETAGGVHSPTLSGTTQLDSYRPLFLPTVLIGDSKLGGISSTISSYESLLLRGYIIDTIMLFRDEYYRNWEYLSPYFAERGVHVVALDPPPERHADRAQDIALTDKYYEKIVPSTQEGGIFDVVRHLDDCHARRLAELASMPGRTLDTIWWPFVQHGLVKSEADVNVLDSASGDFFSVYNGHHPSQPTASLSLLEPQFDGSASWWTQAVGHAHPALALAAARAAGRYGHVMFPQGTHLPALTLAERLVRDGPGKGWAARAFFSDDGSTGMEVALKMALRAFSVKHGLDAPQRKNLGILGLKGSYHGDTIGAMDACEEGVYTCEWHDAKGYWFDPPTVAIRKGKAVVSLPPAIGTLSGTADSLVDTRSLAHTYNMEERLKTPLAETYRSYIEQTLRKLQENGSPAIAALVLEPLVMGAGGMIFVDPLFQRVLIDVVRGSYDSPATRPASQWVGLPVIFDEVFVGLYRLGLQSTGPLLGVHPDISVNAKILTGGLVPLAVTMASDSIFQAFYSDKKVDALLHGHSYTAYPVGCEVANATLDVLEKLTGSEEWQVVQHKWNVPESKEARDTAVWSFWDPDFVNAISHLDTVEEVMAFGTVLSIKVKDTSGGYQSHSAQKMLESIKSGPVEDKLSSAPGGAPFGIHYRTLGDVAYFMLSLNTSAHTVRSVEGRIWAAMKNVSA
ncbi:onanonoxo-7-onima-8-eninoihtemlysoneda [Obba rivulosa]|uniref:Onanonoxo-7-onima-8-eninoihtemlysoneda n=1 Tax=Obba rivulosa TaxID=1052685 RepID=A0A8E2DKD1_9APHY|nr:onanonoxo-7-onima-8-eninoihtemlysoneda [Obba rivulosa]